MNRYGFDIRVHSAFKRAIKPNHMYIEVAADNEAEALEQATRSFRNRTGAGAEVDLRYLARSYYGRDEASIIGAASHVISAELRDWTDLPLGCRH